MIKNRIVVADDFGISPGVNQAIIKCHTEGIITHTSIMVTANYCEDASQLIKQNPKLNVGLHLDLTSGKSLSKNVSFRQDFLGLMISSYFNKKDIELEVEAQIKKAISYGITLSHIDGHRHVHMIPPIFRIVKRMAKKYNIPHIRIVNESVFHTIMTSKNLRFLINGGIIKYVLLKAFYYINRTKSSYYFFSILHSCAVTKTMLQNIKSPKKYKKLEIMLHPGNPAIDKNANLNPKDVSHLLSKNRVIEQEASLS